MAARAALLATPGTGGGGPGCERLGDGLLAEPVSAVSSLAFVVAALVIAAPRRAGATRADTGDQGDTGDGGDGGGDDTGAGGSGGGGGGDARGPGGTTTQPTSRLPYATLVAGIGVGSVIQHGPDPAWSDLAHDLPLLATLTYVAADSLADLTGRRRRWWWWVAPTVAVVPLILAAPRAGDLTQVGVAVVAVALTLARALLGRAARRRILSALGLLGAGATLGALSRSGGPLCDPDSLWQGHAAWHVLAATALVVLAPVIGGRHVDRTRGG